MLRAAILLLLLSGCAVPGAEPVRSQAPVAVAPTDASLLQGFKWRAIEVGALRVVPASNVYLRFDGLLATGHDGCNGFSGEHELLPDRRIRFGVLHATRIGCFSDEIAAQAERFGRMLGGTVHYALQNGDGNDVQLILTAPDGQRLVFQRERWTVAERGPMPAPFPQTSPSLIVSRNWRVVTIHGTPVSGGSLLSLDPVNGKVEVDGGCNSISGPFNFVPSEQKVRFGALTATRKACAEAAMNEQERRLLEALQGTMIYSVADGLLTLTAANMKTVVFRYMGRVGIAYRAGTASVAGK